MSESVTPTADDVRADLEAVLAEATKSEPVEREPPKAERAAPKAAPAPKDEPEEPDGEKLVPPTGDRPRDQFGRFLATDKSAEAPSEKDDEPATEEITDQPAIKDSEPEKPLTGTPAIAAPQSWSAAARNEFPKLPRAVQEEITRRESEVDDGFRQKAQQLNTYQPIAEALRPYEKKFALRGVNPAAAVHQLLEVQDLLERDPLEGVAYVARSYGVDLRQFAAALQQSQQPQNPEVQAVNDRLGRMEAFLQQQQQARQQHEMAQITTEIEAFRADTAAHPYFDSVRPAMAQLMQNNMAMTLQDAYDHACWAIPEVRARILEDQRNAERLSRATAEKQAAERARRAAVSVASTPTSGRAAPKDTGSVREEIEKQVERWASR